MFLQLKRDKAILAPLAGWTDTVFRRLCKRFGASVVYSEMVSAEGIVYRKSKTLALCSFTDSERPIGIQIFGNEPDHMLQAAVWLQQQRPDFIDINFCCPVAKVVKRGAGAALLREPEKMVAIVRAVKQVVSIPVTAKIRMGWQDNQTVKIAGALEQAGIDALTIHPRTRQMGFSGDAEWSVIAEIVNAVSVPVIGNGDIRTPEHARQMLDRTGCNAVMVGRAAMGNPWIFEQISSYLTSGTVLSPPSVKARIEVCLQHVEGTVELYGEKRALFILRKQIIKYLQGLPFISDYRPGFFACRSAAQLVQRIAQYDEFLQKYNESGLSKDQG
ncbi:tRNA dihydrouridine synthase DusB [candidate division KSB1 bacterium]|nr:tRNA dihydrouridine synthase DusB [candidate division KSB1 bacterium]